MRFAASVKPRSASIEAVKIRADGTRVPLGLLCAYHRNPLINAWLQFRVWLNARRRPQ